MPTWPDIVFWMLAATSSLWLVFVCLRSILSSVSTRLVIREKYG